MQIRENLSRRDKGVAWRSRNAMIQAPVPAGRTFPMNTIAQVKTVAVNGPNGPANAMMMAVNISDPASALPFVGEVVEQFKLHRMMAPPDTSMLLITLVGGLAAQEFAARWNELAERDDVVRHFMSSLTVADVVQGTKAGQELSKASLLLRSRPPRQKPWWKVW
jgi:hypothetical protein